mmetsp:Transcript_34296/g.67529  ORF Transcript_34296/g.67529 Transcript_34296/m.67529 type:complete len:216 (-) Transcript_34296:395-1042(-)
MFLSLSISTFMCLKAGTATACVSWLLPVRAFSWLTSASNKLLPVLRVSKWSNNFRSHIRAYELNLPSSNAIEGRGGSNTRALLNSSHIHRISWTICCCCADSCLCELLAVLLPVSDLAVSECQCSVLLSAAPPPASFAAGGWASRGGGCEGTVPAAGSCEVLSTSLVSWFPVVLCSPPRRLRGNSVCEASGVLLLRLVGFEGENGEEVGKMEGSW